MEDEVYNRYKFTPPTKVAIEEHHVGVCKSKVCECSSIVLLGAGVSLSETAKANNLNSYDYFDYLLTEIPKQMDDTDRSF